jgi:hypothetical protein
MKKSKPEPIPVDEVAEYNAQFIEHTEHPMSDVVYKWIIGRYTRNKHEFTTSDKFVWHGSCYLLPVYFGYMLFFGVFYWLGGLIYNKYGMARLVMFFALLMIWRINIVIGLMRTLVKKTK